MGSRPPGLGTAQAHPCAREGPSDVTLANPWMTCQQQMSSCPDMTDMRAMAGACTRATILEHGSTLGKQYLPSAAPVVLHPPVAPLIGLSVKRHSA
jgi:hypothetical protein